ncbi:MAG: response regulator [Kofleriaceae bacterium]
MGERRSIESVLVVDDDSKLLRACRRIAGWNVFTADTFETARAIASTEHPDLAIVDLRLGSESGIDLVRELKRDHPQLVIVLCSGYLSVSTAVSAVRAGADHVLFKPVTFQEIVKRVEEEADDEPEADRDETPTLARAEWEHIMRVLADCDGNITVAARRLGIYRSSLQRRLRKYAPQE